MMQPGRKYQAGSTSYRYSINGQEKSTEICEGLTTALYWEYDSRIGRRWNVDPKPDISFSPYICFAGNPIWHSDILGDSIGPNRTVGYNVYVVGKNRDFGSDLSHSRFKKAQKKDPNHTILIETDKLDKKTVSDILTKLGKDGYVKLLALDYHRSSYDNMSSADKDNFFTSLSKGYAGDKTEAFLGMCWAGGGPDIKGKKTPDLTLKISQQLDKAIVYGLKTEANNLTFWYGGDFGATVHPAYAISNDNVSKNERNNQSTWTVSSYSPQLKKYTSVQVKETIKFSIEGRIIREKYVSDYEKLLNPPKIKYRDF